MLGEYFLENLELRAEASCNGSSNTREQPSSTAGKTAKGTYNMLWKNFFVILFKIGLSSRKTFNTSTISKNAKGTSWVF